MLGKDAGDTHLFVRRRPRAITAMRTSIKAGGHRAYVTGLHAEVEFFAQACREALRQIDDTEVTRPGRPRLDGPRHTDEDIEVALHWLADTRPLHFDDHPLARGELGGMR